MNALTRLALAGAFALPSLAFGTIYDLGSEWSDVANPNGHWTLEKNFNSPFTTTQADFFSDGSNQVAWADDSYPNQAHVPVWFKANRVRGDDYVVGDIVMHGAVNWRTGSMVTSAVWTSDLNGTATLSGSTWLVRQIGRQMDWGLYKNGNLLTGGRLVGNGSTSRINQVGFETGSGGIGSLTQSIAMGDRLELRYTALDELPDLAGVNFSVDAVPEPTSMAVLGLGVLALFRRRSRGV